MLNFQRFIVNFSGCRLRPGPCYWQDRSIHPDRAMEEQRETAGAAGASNEGNSVVLVGRIVPSLRYLIFKHCCCLLCQTDVQRKVLERNVTSLFRLEE